MVYSLVYLTLIKSFFHCQVWILSGEKKWVPFFCPMEVPLEIIMSLTVSISIPLLIRNLINYIKICFGGDMSDWAEYGSMWFCTAFITELIGFQGRKSRWENGRGRAGGIKLRCHFFLSIHDFSSLKTISVSSPFGSPPPGGVSTAGRLFSCHPVLNVFGCCANTPRVSTQNSVGKSISGAKGSTLRPERFFW